MALGAGGRPRKKSLSPPRRMPSRPIATARAQAPVPPLNQLSSCVVAFHPLLHEKSPIIMKRARHARRQARRDALPSAKPEAKPCNPTYSPERISSYSPSLFFHSQLQLNNNPRLPAPPRPNNPPPPFPPILRRSLLNRSSRVSPRAKPNSNASATTTPTRKVSSCRPSTQTANPTANIA